MKKVSIANIKPLLLHAVGMWRSVLVVGVFALTGYVALHISHAATYTATSEAESGTLSGNASTGSSSGASGGQAVGFNAAPPSPSGESVPTGDLTGWHQIFYDDFTKDAATGSWGSDCDSEKIVYTGAQGQQWKAYPKCFTDTYDGFPYRSDQVLSVHDGTLDFYLHQVEGKAAGANPSPVIANGSQYQTYGRYTMRFKTTTRNLGSYYVAWLLWPQSEQWPEDGEEDFPEGGLAGKIGGFHHYVDGGSCSNGCQDAASSNSYFDSWHTYTVEWRPGNIKYILDGQTILNTTSWTPHKPMRWQLQTETNGNGGDQGHLLVDWVAAYSYNG